METTILQNQDTARAWLKQYTSKPEEGRKSLISIAPLFDNDTLWKIMQKPEHGPQQGLAVSILYERQRQKLYEGKLSFEADWAGAYITVHEDYWGTSTRFVGKKVLYGAALHGKGILRHAYIVGFSGVLTRSIIEGEDALRHAYISSGSGLKHAVVHAKNFMWNAEIIGEEMLWGSTIIGDYAFVKTRFTGNYILNYATIKGMCVLSKSHFEGEDPLIEAVVEGEHNRSLMTVTDPWEA